MDLSSVNVDIYAFLTNNPVGSKPELCWKRGNSTGRVFEPRYAEYSSIERRLVLKEEYRPQRSRRREMEQHQKFMALLELLYVEYGTRMVGTASARARKDERTIYCLVDGFKYTQWGFWLLHKYAVGRGHNISWFFGMNLGEQAAFLHYVGSGVEKHPNQYSYRMKNTPTQQELDKHIGEFFRTRGLGTYYKTRGDYQLFKSRGRGKFDKYLKEHWKEISKFFEWLKEYRHIGNKPLSMHGIATQYESLFKSWEKAKHENTPHRPGSPGSEPVQLPLF